MTDISPKKGRAYSTAFEDHKQLIHQMARKGYLRLQGAHISIDYEDVFQEMCVTYAKAVNKYNPEYGVTFTAYLGRAIWNEFNSFAEREITHKIELCSVSIEGALASSEDSDIDLYEVLPSDEPTPEQILEAKQRNKLCKDKKTRAFVAELIKTVADPNAPEDVSFTGVARKAGLMKDRKKIKHDIYEIYGIKLGSKSYDFEEQSQHSF